MIVIICAKYKKNPSRTVDATERTQFSKSRPNDLEDIVQGQGSSHATHPLMLLIICTKYEKNPSWTVDATGRRRKVNGQTDRDRQTETDRQRQTDRQTDRVNPIYPPNFVAGGIKKELGRPDNIAKLSHFKMSKNAKKKTALQSGQSSNCLCNSI